MWPGTGPLRGSGMRVPADGRKKREIAGKRKKIELCAARPAKGARKAGREILQRFKGWSGAGDGSGNHPFFTESLILAQNERWRRV